MEQIQIVLREREELPDSIKSTFRCSKSSNPIIIPAIRIKEIR